MAHFHTIAKHLLIYLELAVLLVTIVAFWHHAPHIRDHWVWLLWLAQPFFALRLLLHGRLFTPLTLIWLLLLLLPLMALNYNTAPLTRSHYIVVACRPLLGIWLVVYMVEYARIQRRLDGLLLLTIGMGALLAFLGITTTIFETSKTVALNGIIAALPRFDYRQVVPDMLLGFNPNEVGGAMAWLCPLLLGLLAYPNNAHETPGQRLRLWFIRLAGFATGAALLFALFLGQSRFALAGVLLALMLLAVLLSANWRWRIPATAGVGALIVLQVMIFFNVGPADLVRLLQPTDPASTSGAGTALAAGSRDEQTLQSRLDTWAVTLQMVADYPTTGVGMAMFRTAARQPRYDTIPYYQGRGYGPPHAHNELLQLGADFGIPGLLLYAACTLIILRMVWRCWRQVTRVARVPVLTIGAGLLAHAVYGLGDAITLWDRFGFLLWWMLGLLAAHYVLTIRATPHHEVQSVR